MGNKDIYRGKKIIDNKWVYGTPLDFENGEVSISAISYYEGSLYEPPTCEVDDFNVIPETVGQSIGVKGICYDKLTHEECDCDIFEGDIVLVSYDGEIMFEGVVGYKDGAFIINTNPDIFTFYKLLNPDKQVGDARFEFVVVGNKWDNPEMFREIFDE